MNEPIERQPDQPQEESRGFLTFFQVVKYAVITAGVLGAAGFAFVYWELSHLTW